MQAFDGMPPHGVSVRLSIYSITRALVAILANGPQESGRYTVTWNAAAQPAGVYIVRLEAGNAGVTRKITLEK